MHGMGGAPSDFEPFGCRLAAEGWRTVAFAVRGQGLDPEPGRRGAFLDPAVIAGDLRAFVREVAGGSPGPRFFVGESLGALLGAHALAWGGLRFDAAVFSAPVVELARPTPSWARVALRFLARAFPEGRLRPAWFVTGGPRAPKTSRDEQWVAAQRRGPQSIAAFSFRVLLAVGVLMESMPAAASRITLPSLVLAAGCDIFVKPHQVQKWFEQLASPSKEFRLYPEAFHVLWNDWDREQVLEDVAGWLDALASQKIGGLVGEPSLGQQKRI